MRLRVASARAANYLCLAGLTTMTMWARLFGSKFGETPMTTTAESAVLAGGCFWGMQDLIRRKPGVISTRRRLSGGDVKNATYRNHGTHAEAIEIIFDPRVLSFRDILEFFFQIHDLDHAQPPGVTISAPATVRSSSTPAPNRSGSHAIPSPMSTHRACGRARWSRKCRL